MNVRMEVSVMRSDRESKNSRSGPAVDLPRVKRVVSRYCLCRLDRRAFVPAHE